MAIFRFRLAAALELRRQQDAEAQRARSVAALTLQAAEAAERAAGDTLADALERATAAERAGNDAPALAWHRNWIIRWRVEIAKRREVVTKRTADLRIAAERALEAQRKFRSIDRLRERALEAHVAESRRIEQQEMDRFGVLRFTIRARTEAAHATPAGNTLDREENSR